MTRGGTRLRGVFAGTDSILAAPIYDPLSARLASLRGWDVCKLSGTVWKGAELAQPDDVSLANMSDLVDIARRILRAADVALTVDADDGGGTALNVVRTVQELEAVGVAGIEIEEYRVPGYPGEVAERHALEIGVDEHVGKLKAAVQARRDESTVIIGRTLALCYHPLDEALDRIRAYSGTGVDAIFLVGLDHLFNGGDGRTEVEAVHRVTDLPLITLGLPPSVEQDTEFLSANNVKVRYVLDFPLLRAAMKGIDDSLAFLESGGDTRNMPQDIASRLAPLETIKPGSPKTFTRWGEMQELTEKYVNVERDRVART